MGILENFLEDHKKCYEGFCEVVGKKLKPQVNGKGLVTYKFGEPVNKIFSDFLKNRAYQDCISELDRDDEAEEDYLEKLKEAKSAVARKGIEDDTLRRKIENNFDKINRVISYIFQQNFFTTSIIKQCEARYQKHIEKYPFLEDQMILILQGLFLVMIKHKFAKDAEIRRAEADMEENQEEETETKKGQFRPRGGRVAKPKQKKLESKKQPIDNIYSNPRLLTNNTGVLYVGDSDFSENNLNLDKNFGSKLLAECYIEALKSKDGKPGYGDAKEKICNWVHENEIKIKSLTQFREEVQEGPHRLLLVASDDDPCRQDPFVRFIFNKSDSSIESTMLDYPYFFNGSKKKNLSIYDMNFPDVKGYSYPAGVDVFNTNQTISDLDKKLKPIFFRSVTSESKKYKKVSMKDLHSIAEQYYSLLTEKIINYIRVTYQCEESHILVSFETRSFDPPPVVLSEAEFKELFKKHPGRVVYKGMRNPEHFEYMKKKGVWGIAKHHADQEEGIGVYWTEKLETAQAFGPIIAMAIVCDDFSKITDDIIDQSLNCEDAGMKTFLMRDNRWLMIRETAMYDKSMELDDGSFEDNDLRKLTELEEKLEHADKVDNIVGCETDEEIANWLDCR